MQEHDDAIEAFEKEDEKAPKPNTEVAKESKDIDPELEKALATGYNPDHPSGLTARDWNIRGPLLEEISDRGKELKNQAKEIAELKKMIRTLGDQMTKSESRSLEKEAQEIHRQRMEAVESGDTARFEALDRQYQELHKSVSPTPTVQEMSPAAKSFIDRNSDWFNYDTAENAVMHDEAVDFEARYIARREIDGKPPLSHAVLGKRIEEYIKMKFPHRFENTEATKPPAVAASHSNVVDKEETASLDDLSPFQKEVFQRMRANDPSMTVDKYLGLIGKRTVRIE